MARLRFQPRYRVQCNSWLAVVSGARGGCSLCCAACVQTGACAVMQTARTVRALQTDLSQNDRVVQILSSGRIQDAL